MLKKVWQVTLTYCWDTIVNTEETYYFETEQEAKEFTEKGNAILHQSEAYYCYRLHRDEWPTFIRMGGVDGELAKLKEDFKNYKY